MIEWSENAYIVRTRPYGEESLVVDVMTQSYGRCSGLVRGGRSKRKQGIIQIGNKVQANWRARLSEHLGVFNLELVEARSAILMQSKISLYALQAICSLNCLVCAERQPYPYSYKASDILIQHLYDSDIWPALYVRWEWGLLSELGYGIDTRKCAITGEKDNLAFVSPKSGRSASYNAGIGFSDKLLKLPLFLVDSKAHADQSDIRNGLTLTGYFLERRVLWPLNQRLSEARELMIESLKEKGYL